MILTTTRKVELDSKLIKQLETKFMTPEYKFPKDSYLDDAGQKPPEDFLNSRIYSSWDEMTKFYPRLDYWEEFMLSIVSGVKFIPIKLKVMAFTHTAAVKNLYHGYIL